MPDVFSDPPVLRTERLVLRLGCPRHPGQAAIPDGWTIHQTAIDTRRTGPVTFMAGSWRGQALVSLGTSWGSAPGLGAGRGSLGTDPSAFPRDTASSVGHYRYISPT